MSQNEKRESIHQQEKAYIRPIDPQRQAYCLHSHINLRRLEYIPEAGSLIACDWKRVQTKGIDVCFFPVSSTKALWRCVLPFIIPGFLALRCKGKGRQVQTLAHTRTQYECFYTLMIYNHNQILLLKNIPSSALLWKIRNTFVATEIRSNRTVCSVTVTLKYTH